MISSSIIILLSVIGVTTSQSINCYECDSSNDFSCTEFWDPTLPVTEQVDAVFIYFYNYMFFRPLVYIRIAETCYSWHRVYQGCRLNLGKRSKVIFWGSLLITSQASSVFWVSLGSSKNWLKPRINPPNQLKLA